jgi:hypothetical protein
MNNENYGQHSVVRSISDQRTLSVRSVKPGAVGLRTKLSLCKPYTIDEPRVCRPIVHQDLTRGELQLAFHVRRSSLT